MDNYRNHEDIKRMNTDTLEDHDERRKYPRIKLNIPVCIGYGNNVVDARIYDLSPDGLQIRSSYTTLQMIYPLGVDTTRDKSPELYVAFNLNIHGSEIAINATCIMLYFNQLSEDTDENAVCGFQFVDMDALCRKYLDTFVSESMEPA